MRCADVVEVLEEGWVRGWGEGGGWYVGEGSRSFRHLGLLMGYHWSVLGLMCSVILGVVGGCRIEVSELVESLLIVDGKEFAMPS